MIKITISKSSPLLFCYIITYGGNECKLTQKIEDKNNGLVEDVPTLNTMTLAFCGCCKSKGIG
jgi:hypothetical protein